MFNILQLWNSIRNYSILTTFVDIFLNPFFCYKWRKYMNFLIMILNPYSELILLISTNTHKASLVNPFLIFTPPSPWSMVKSLPITYHLLPITYHLSPITYHLLPITYHLSPITYYQLPITYHRLLPTDHRPPFTLFKSLLHGLIPNIPKLLRPPYLLVIGITSHSINCFLVIFMI